MSRLPNSFRVKSNHPILPPNSSKYSPRELEVSLSTSTDPRLHPNLKNLTITQFPNLPSRHQASPLPFLHKPTHIFLISLLLKEAPMPLDVPTRSLPLVRLLRNLPLARLVSTQPAGVPSRTRQVQTLNVLAFRPPGSIPLDVHHRKICGPTMIRSTSQVSIRQLPLKPLSPSKSHRTQARLAILNL